MRQARASRSPRRLVAVPADRDKPKASTHSLERGADGRGIPALPALGGRDPIRVQAVRDRVQALAGLPLAPDPLEHVDGDGRGPAEADAPRARLRESRPDPLRVQPPLAGDEAGAQLNRLLP